ncbi:hypothetical protein V496_02398 [Pseudogymnoascus sp. VKM F-4515 (FW-2607)]|nr:hypothetical protein V496_02398 [Pseudogymnoascus sp. VKM F-4515 (FW-2607)]
MEDKIPLDANHSMIVKFNSKNNRGCTSARDKLRQFEQDAPSCSAGAKQTKAFLDGPVDSAFVGREDILLEIDKKLEQAASQEHSRVALVGQGGIGKSQIAIEYAYRLRESAPQT